MISTEASSFRLTPMLVPVPPQTAIDCQVYRQYQRAENNLNFMSQRFRIQDCRQRTGHEISYVSCFAGLCPQPILQRCQGAEPAAEFDKHPQATAGRYNHARRGDATSKSPPTRTKSTKPKWSMTTRSASRGVEHSNSAEKVSGWRKWQSKQPGDAVGLEVGEGTIR